jgi:tetratricopeptide (TPR) repeat protein
LDAIVAMAMRKEPDRRYPSVEALADDLRRHLQGEPVRARQGGWRYGAAKFVRRHFFGAVVTAAVFVGLVVVAGVTLWQNHRIGLARDVAAQERDRAQEVSSFLVDVFSQADPYNAQGKEPTARDLLDAGAAKISANLSLQPEVRAQLLESIALAYRHQGQTERAIKLFEQAVSIRREEHPMNNRNVAAALSNLARALTDGGFFVSAEGYLQQAIELVQADDPASQEAADILVQYGHFALNAKSDPVRARVLFSQALAIYRGLPGDQHLSIAATLSALSSTAMWSGDFVIGEQYQRDALAIFRATVSRNHPDHAVALASLGYILTQRGKYGEAEQSLNEALEIERNVFGPDDLGVASIEKDLGTLYGREGDLRRAMSSTEDALRIATKRLGNANYLRGYYLDSLAHLKLLANDVNGAQADSLEALKIYDATLAKRHLYVASARYLLGEVYLRRQMLADAESQLRTAVDIDTALAGADNWQTARSQASLAWILMQEGKDSEGEPMLVAAQSRLQATVGPQHPETQQATSRLVQYYREHHRESDATHLLLLSEKR